MKRIAEYRKLLGVTKSAELKDLKTIYRNFMKDHHPDTLQGSDEEKLAAEEKSKSIISAYHFLVSIAPETVAKEKEEYTKTTTTIGISDYQYKSQILQMFFLDGTSYEYFGVPKAVYIKLVNADSPARFARRHIYNAYIYRKAGSATAE